MLDSGYVLLNSERTPDGGYKAGAGMDGMYMMTGQVFQPLQDETGRIIAFMAQEPEREKQIVHQGYAIIDRMQAGAVEFVLGENPRAPQPYVTWRHTIGDAPTDFYWGHYFGSYHKAKADLKNRAKEYIQMNNEEKPTSVRAQLAQMQQEQKQASPNPARVQEER